MTELFYLLWLLSPTPMPVPQDVTINIPVILTNATIQTNQLVPLPTSINDSPCAAEWASIGEDQPYELAADDPNTMVGDAFRCLGPGPAKRLDGSQN